MAEKDREEETAGEEWRPVEEGMRGEAGLGIKGGKTGGRERGKEDWKEM